MGNGRDMQQDEVIALLERYKTELEGILGKFTETLDGIHIDRKDDARFKELAFELRDLFDDAFVDGQRHSQPLISHFHDSISNFVGSPSYHGVETLRVLLLLPFRVFSAIHWPSRRPLYRRSCGEKDRGVVLTLAERSRSSAPATETARQSSDARRGGRIRRARPISRAFDHLF